MGLLLAVGATAASPLGGASASTARIVLAATVAYDPEPDTQVYSVDSTGRSAAQLTFASAPVSNVRPSPDGRSLVFERGGAIWTMRPDGRGQRLLVKKGTEPSWAPDSLRIVYVALAGDRRLGIRSIRPDGTAARWVVSGDVTSPAWSPDGRSLAFGRGGSLVVVRGGRDRTIAHSPNVRVARIAWSFDGGWLAFGEPTHPGKLVVVRADGRRRIELPYRDFAWSPNRLLLAYSRWAFDASAGVYTLDPRTGHRKQLTHDQYTDSLAWSPAGDAIALGISLLTSEGPAVSRLATVTLSGRLRLLDTGERFPLPEVIAWPRAPGGMHYRPPQPVGPLVSGDELRMRTPVAELATDSDRVAYRTCLSIGVWRPGDPTVVTVRPELPFCGTTNVAFYSLALADAGNQIAWGDQRGGNSQCGRLVLAPVASDASQRVIADGGCHTTGDPRGEARVGSLLGIGPLLVFSTWTYCDEVAGNTCSQLPPMQRPIASQTLWRVCGPTWPGTCPGTSDQQLRVEPGPLRPLDVDLGSRAVPIPRVLASGDNATLLLSSYAGAELLSLPLSTPAGQISGPDLVVLLPGELRHYDATTGELLRTWPMPTVSIGGRCGNIRRVCGEPELHLEDVANGLATYVLDRKVHVLDLATGRDVVVHVGTVARFGADGLFYAYAGPAPWPGRIGLTRWNALPND